jgi:hypothetical protein
MTVSEVILHPLFLLLVGALLTLFAAMYWNMRAGKEKLETRLLEMEKSLALVTASVVPISTAFQAILIKELTHEATPEMDALLVKVGPPYTLSHAEERKLVGMLQERAELEGTLMTASEKYAAKMLPWVIMRVNAESVLNIPELTAAAMARGRAALNTADAALENGGQERH